jgi:hypothetical protein
MADAWLRQAWANDAGQAFQHLCSEFVDADPFLVFAKWDGEYWELSFQGARDEAQAAAVFQELSRQLGAFLDHTRAALNYTAVEVARLAARENPELTDIHPTAVEFPIFDSATLYKRQNRLKKLPAKYCRHMEEAQPFHGGHQSLWRLQELAGAYRHHVVHPAVVQPEPTQHRVVVDGEEIAPSAIHSLPSAGLAVGDVFMRFDLPGIPPGTPVEPRPVLTFGIDHPLCEGDGAIGVMNEMIQEATEVMGAIEAALFGLRAGPTVAP